MDKIVPGQAGSSENLQTFFGADFFSLTGGRSPLCLSFGCAQMCEGKKTSPNQMCGGETTFVCAFQCLPTFTKKMPVPTPESVMRPSVGASITLARPKMSGSRLVPTAVYIHHIALPRGFAHPCSFKTSPTTNYFFPFWYSLALIGACRCTFLCKRIQPDFTSGTHRALFIHFCHQQRHVWSQNVSGSMFW